MDDFPSSVFLSFNKEDTGRTFVSHLQRRLDQKGTPTCIDEEQEQERDVRITPQLATAIRESKAIVVVISENYASSVRCLNVLAEIIQPSRLIRMPTISTVFYEVDSEDLTRQTGKFADDLRRHEERETLETVTRWRNALELLQRTQSRYFSRNWEDDSKMLDALISSICPPIYADQSPMSPVYEKQHVDAESSVFSLISEAGLESEDRSLTDNELSNESPYRASDDSNGLVGMYRHKTAVYALLDLESKNKVRTVGVWGESGVGKTTLVECLFNDISSRFQHHCYLSNGNNIYQNHISPGLLKHLTSKKHSDNIFDAIKPFLVNRHVLLVIDGAHDTDHGQLKDAMKVSLWLGPGSRVIITSRSDKTPKSCGVKYIYHMKSLRYEEALQLFSRCAFKKPNPGVGFEGFSIRAVHFAGCLPLALKVLGSFLYGKDLERWKQTFRKLEASQDDGGRWIAKYIGAGEYLPRRQTELEHYFRAEEEKKSASYHMLL